MAAVDGVTRWSQAGLTAGAVKELPFVRDMAGEKRGPALDEAPPHIGRGRDPDARRRRDGSGAGTVCQVQGPGCEIVQVVGERDAHRLRQPSWAARQPVDIARPTPPPHPVQSFNGFQRPNEDGSGMMLPFGDYVHAGMVPITKIDIGGPREAPHHLAARRPPVGMTRGIARTAVRFHFDDPAGQPPARCLVDQVAAQHIARDRKRSPSIERPIEAQEPRRQRPGTAGTGGSGPSMAVS
jgi:hypothetical protein